MLPRGNEQEHKNDHKIVVEIVKDFDILGVENESLRVKADTVYLKAPLWVQRDKILAHSRYSFGLLFPSPL